MRRLSLWLFSAIIAPAATLSVDAIQTQMTTGASTGYATYGLNPGFSTHHLYALSFSGQQEAIVAATAGGEGWTVGQRPDLFQLVLNTGLPPRDTHQTAWFRNTATPSAFGGTAPITEELLLGQNNLMTGTDNLFSNAGNHQVERADYLYSTPLTAVDNRAFGVFARSSGGFQIAAITGMQNGQPSSYGMLVAIPAGWGGTGLGNPGDGTILSRNTVSEFRPQFTEQGVWFGGVMVRFTDLVPAGMPIYGFSLFALDVTPGMDLTNPSTFPTNTVDSLDLLSANTGYFETSGAPAAISSVPEPGTFGLAALAIALLLRRQRSAI